MILVALLHPTHKMRILAVFACVTAACALLRTPALGSVREVSGLQINVRVDAGSVCNVLDFGR